MLDYVRGEVDVGSILDERETGFAPARVAAHGDVRLKVRDIPRLAVFCLLRDGAEEQLEGLDEAPLCPARSRRCHARPEARMTDPQRKRAHAKGRHRRWRADRTRRYSPLGKPPYSGRGAEAARVAKRTNDFARSANCPAVVHLVADVVKMEQVVDEVAADAQAIGGCEGIAHRGEKPTLETLEGGALLLAEMAALEKPSLRLC